MLLEPKVTSGIECSPSLLTNAALTASARNLAITQLKLRTTSIKYLEVTTFENQPHTSFLKKSHPKMLMQYNRLTKSMGFPVRKTWNPIPAPSLTKCH